MWQSYKGLKPYDFVRFIQIFAISSFRSKTIYLNHLNAIFFFWFSVMLVLLCIHGLTAVFLPLQCKCYRAYCLSAIAIVMLFAFVYFCLHGTWHHKRIDKIIHQICCRSLISVLPSFLSVFCFLFLFFFSSMRVLSLSLSICFRFLLAHSHTLYCMDYFPFVSLHYALFDFNNIMLRSFKKNLCFSYAYLHFLLRALCSISS